jgi:poly(3-hydroxybutyrate) depolymerase
VARAARHLAIALAWTLVLAAPPLSPRASPAAATTLAGPELPRQQVVRRSLRTDPDQQYLVYVPQGGGRGAPVFITVHGVSRNVEEHASLFAPFAERYHVVLVAPCFDRGRNDGYQRLGLDASGRGADATLEAIVSEVIDLTGAARGPLHLFGFSGGAQFAHRFVLAHPERVAAAVVAAPGWYTFPDPDTPYPYGLGAGEDMPRVPFDPGRFLGVPVMVFVGTADTTGGENLRRNAALDRQQGTTRRERARRWVAAMRAAAQARGLDPRVTCEEVPGIGHSFRQFMLEGMLGERTFATLFGAPPASAPSRGAAAMPEAPAGAGRSAP